MDAISLLYNLCLIHGLKPCCIWLPIRWANRFKSCQNWFQQGQLSRWNQKWRIPHLFLIKGKIWYGDISLWNNFARYSLFKKSCGPKATIWYFSRVTWISAKWPRWNHFSFEIDPAEIILVGSITLLKSFCGVHYPAEIVSAGPRTLLKFHMRFFNCFTIL
jgi:hypothetical protein